MSNFEKLQIKPETQIDHVVKKPRFQYELDANAQTTVAGPLGSFDVFRTTYRDIDFTMYEERNGDRIGASQDEYALVREVMSLAGIGIAGSTKAALVKAAEIGSTAGKIAVKAGGIGAAAGCFALTGTGKVLESLAKAAIKQSLRMNPDLDRKVEIPSAKPTAENKAAKRDQPVKSGPIMMNQYEAALEISNGQGISIIGPLGTVYIERSKDSKDRVMLVIIADEELTVRRSVKEAVDVGLHLAGLSVGSQIEEAGKKAATAGLVIAGKGTEVLAKGLNAAAGAALKMGALLVK